MVDQQVTAEDDDRIPPSSLWRQEVAARADELQSLLSVSVSTLSADDRYKQEQAEAARRYIKGARKAATARGVRGLAGVITGAPIQRAVHNLNMAEVSLYRIVPLDHLQRMLPIFIDDISDVLPATDSRLQRLIQLSGAHEGDDASLSESDRAAVVPAVYAAKQATLTAQGRVRGFRNVILFATCLAWAIVVLIAIAGTLAPEIVSVCQPADGAIGSLCPSGFGARSSPYDVLLLILAGVIGATLAAVFALRKVRGTRDPYSLVLALAMLKLPTGAITAFIGPFLIRSGFVPGWANFDSPQQFVAWAFLFGYSQELFTSLVDRQAAAVLSSVPTSGVVVGPAGPADRPIKSA